MEKSSSPISTQEMSSKRKISIEVPIVNSRTKDETEVLSEKLDKKIIKLSEVSNMDPLDYFSRFLDIPEMIFKHFKGKDLLKASEVRPRYFNFIASSKVLMKKIKIVFDRDIDYNGRDLVRIQDEIYPNLYNYTTSSKDLMEAKIVFNDKIGTQLEDFNLLKNSSRLYQNIEVRRSAGYIEDEIGNHREVGDYITDSELDFFQSKAHEWKTVSLINVYFRKNLDLWRFLSAIESSVESIIVWDLGVLSLKALRTSEINPVEVLKFPKLKELMVFLKANSFSETFVRFLFNSVAIEELDLMDNTGEVGRGILTKMLTNLDKVKRLAIASRKSNQIFKDESWKKFQFKLKSLAINLTDIGRRDHVTNFLNFIKSQSDHLENLKTSLICQDRETIFDMIMTMPRLKILGFWFFETFSDNEVPTKISTSVTELTLLECNNSAVGLNFLLNSMPKVRNLSLLSIDDEEFKMLKSLKRKFEILRVCELKGVDIKELEEIMTENYTSLKTVKLSDLLNH